jgi:hypothetical protein
LGLKPLIQALGRDNFLVQEHIAQALTHCLSAGTPLLPAVQWFLRLIWSGSSLPAEVVSEAVTRLLAITSSQRIRVVENAVAGLLRLSEIGVPLCRPASSLLAPSLPPACPLVCTDLLCLTNKSAEAARKQLFSMGFSRLLQLTAWKNERIKANCAAILVNLLRDGTFAHFHRENDLFFFFLLVRELITVAAENLNALVEGVQDSHVTDLVTLLTVRNLTVFESVLDIIFLAAKHSARSFTLQPGLDSGARPHCDDTQSRCGISCGLSCR